MKLNGLLASPSFAAWAAGPPLDVDQLLFRDGKPRCAIVTTAHLSDDERQFVTSLVLSKLITWMRRQSGVTDLRTMLYMDEVAGYLPPTENPPTKKPIMTLMKQARAFGVGVVLATQNPVDIDYKAISNAGTWMVGRLQTERDKQRLLDGMSAAAGGVDVAAVSDTISALGKRQFVLRRAGKDAPEMFTTRWAMSYLRGPLTRDQISTLDEAGRRLRGRHIAAAPPSAPATEPATEATSAPPDSTATGLPRPTRLPPLPPATTTPVADDETPVMPDIAGGVAVRYVDPAAPWLASGRWIEHRRSARGGGGRPRRPALRRVVRPATWCTTPSTRRFSIRSAPHVDVTTVVPGRLRRPRPRPTRRPTARSTGSATRRSARSRSSPTSSAPSPTISPAACRWSCRATRRSKLFGSSRRDSGGVRAALRGVRRRAGRGRDRQAARQVRGEGSQAARPDRRRRRSGAGGRTSRRAERERDGLLDAAGDLLGGLLSGRRSKGDLMGSVLQGRRLGAPSATDQRRREEAQNKVSRLEEDLAEVEAELADEITEIDAAWRRRRNRSRRSPSRSRSPTSRSPSSAWPGSRSSDLSELRLAQQVARLRLPSSPPPLRFGVSPSSWWWTPGHASNRGNVNVGRLLSTTGAFALGFAFVLICLNAMRVGLLTRFMGILGLIVGANHPALDQQGIIRVFWLGALAALILGRWPAACRRPGRPARRSPGPASRSCASSARRPARSATRARSAPRASRRRPGGRSRPRPSRTPAPRNPRSRKRRARRPPIG